jgi:hypothetical protein
LALDHDEGLQGQARPVLQDGAAGGLERRDRRVVRDGAHYTICFTGITVPYVCTSGAQVCGN